MIWATVKMILALGGILVLLFCLVRLFKRWEWGSGSPGTDGGSVLSSKLIALRTYLLVEIAGRFCPGSDFPADHLFGLKIENQEMVKKSLLPHDIRPSSCLGERLSYGRREGILLERGNEK
jgi:hypothetical protein